MVKPDDNWFYPQRRRRIAGIAKPLTDVKTGRKCFFSEARRANSRRNRFDVLRLPSCLPFCRMDNLTRGNDAVKSGCDLPSVAWVPTFQAVRVTFDYFQCNGGVSRLAGGE
jgi:hypothetical protein